MKMIKLIVVAALAVLSMLVEASVSVKSVTARQRYPWNGKVDVTVMLEGTAAELASCQCMFAATNSATKKALPVVNIVKAKDDSFSGNVCMRQFLWDAALDVGEVKIAEVALSVGTKAVIATGGVQLWENGPYWAECNIGATKPGERGYYFWWGDTVGYKRNAGNTAWVSVKSGSSFEFITANAPTEGRACFPLYSLGFLGESGNLASAHDAATAHLGAPWRMPTAAEFDALTNKCDVGWFTQDGVSGFKFTGRGAYSSNSIFLPYTGFGNETALSQSGSSGSYWSSTPFWNNLAWNDRYLLSSHCLALWSRYDPEPVTRGFEKRRIGLPVRPVRDAAK